MTANNPHTPAAPRDRCARALPGRCDQLHTCGKIHLHTIPHTNCHNVGGHPTRDLGIFIQMHVQRYSGGLHKPTRVIWKVTFFGDSVILHKGRVGADEDSPPIFSEMQFWSSFIFLGFLLPSGSFMCKHLHVLRAGGGGRGAPFAGDSCALWKSPEQMSYSGRA